MNPAPHPGPAGHADGTCARVIPALVAVIAIIAHACAAEVEGADPTYVVSGTLVLGGKGGCAGIACDVARHRIYLSRTDHLQIIDTSGMPLADFACGIRLRGLALVGTRAFVADGTGAVQVVEVAPAEVKGAIPMPRAATAVVADPGGDLYACLHDGNALVSFAAMIAADGKPGAAIDLGGKPAVAVADGRGHLYVGLDDGGDQIAVVSTVTRSVSARWPLGAGHHPVGIAIDPDGAHLFAATADRHLFVIDTATGAIHGDLPTAADPGDCVFTGGAAVVACASGSLTIARPAGPGGYTVAQTLTIPPGSRHLAVDGQGILYLPAEDLAVGTGVQVETRGFRLLMVARLPQLP